jgi:hypothetical protein
MGRAAECGKIGIRDLCSPELLSIGVVESLEMTACSSTPAARRNSISPGSSRVLPAARAIKDSHLLRSRLKKRPGGEATGEGWSKKNAYADGESNQIFTGAPGTRPHARANT